MLSRGYGIGLRNRTLPRRPACSRLNPDCRVEPWDTRLTSQNVAEILQRYDLVIDGSDNLATR